MSYCVKYYSKLYNLLFPSPSEFSILCTSYDKSRVFIMVFLRIILYLILFQYFYEKQYTDILLTTKIFLLIFFLFMITINVGLLIYVTIVPQLYSKDIAHIIIEKKEFIPRQWYNSLLEKEQPTCPAGTFKSGGKI